MAMNYRWWMVGLLSLTSSALARADHPNERVPFWRCWCLAPRICPSVGCCPDDYDRKPCPPIGAIFRCGCPDDYGRKPALCLPFMPRCGGPDDYCRKPIPTLLCPPYSPFLRCTPWEPSCIPAQHPHFLVAP